MRLICTLALLILAAAPLLAAGLPSPPVLPEGLGVNIHFTGAPAKDLDMLAAGGFRFIRMDFPWAGVEREKGVYDFAPYDELTAALAARGIRPLYILDYGNKLYESANSVVTEPGRQAFARFAAAAAAHFKGHGIIWELWNEPNGGNFWTNPDPKAYMALAKVVFPAIRAADPQAHCIGPATSGVDLSYIRVCGQEGLFQLVDAVSVHPYRDSPPETAAADLLRLRAMICQFAPDRPDLPIISGEWGYSSAWPGVSADRQGLYLARAFLSNLSLGVPLSIWYDWHDDGPDPKESEHHFGTVTLDYQPKPAYQAMRTLTEALKGRLFSKRLESAADDYLLMFWPPFTLAAWTTGPAHTVRVGERELALTEAPQYVRLSMPPAVLAEASWHAVARWTGVRADAAYGQPLSPQVTITVRNPFPQPTAVRVEAWAGRGLWGRFVGDESATVEPYQYHTFTWLGTVHTRSEQPLKLQLSADIGGYRSRLTVPFLVIDPLLLQAQTDREGHVQVSVATASEAGFDGQVIARSGRERVVCALRLQKGKASVKPALPMGRDGERLILTLPLRAQPDQPVTVSLREGGATVAQQSLRVSPLAIGLDAAYTYETENNAPARLALAAVPGGCRLTYDCPNGAWAAIATLAQSVPLAGRPVAVGVWARGKPTGIYLSLRFRDGNGIVFEPDLGVMRQGGWRYLEARLDDPTTDLVVPGPHPSSPAPPYEITAIAVFDGDKTAAAGDVELTGWQAVYR